MDAISFVLGIKSAHLRSSQLRDMIYRGRVIRTSKINADGTATEANGDADADPDAEADVEKSSTQTSSQRHDPTTAWVMAIFEDDAEQQHKWKRSITAAGQSEYRIDGRQVSQKAYNDALEEQSILVKARNFLVFQGDVEGVASQNPLKLTEMIEQISGSLEHKEDYKRLKKELEEAETHQTEKLGERRRLNADIKNYQEQKAEADEYEQKVAERDDAIVTHVLWKLFHFQQTIQQSTDEIAKHQEELKEHSRNVEQYERKLNDTKQAHAKSSRDVVKTEKNIRAKEKEIEDAQNNLVPIDAKIDISNKDLSKYEARIAQLNKERNTLTQTIDKYKKDLAVVEKAKKKWEADIQAVAQQQGRDLSAQDLIEYNKLRGEVTKKTFADQTEVNRLQREVETDRDTVRNLKQKVDSLQSTVEKLEGEISQLEEQQQEAKAKGKDLEKEKATKQQAYNKMQSDRRQLENARTELNEHLQEHLRKLYEAEGGQRQSKKEIQSRENVAQMKRIFGSGVYGRVRELCKPKQKKFEKAVETLLGGELEAVIVDKERTAQECIKYLKEHKIGTYKLVPLDVLQVKAVNQNLKGMHPGVRLGIDCIDYDSNLERVFAAACGSSIICDDLKIARHFCYEKKVDVKAVTLDGTVIAKGGTMSGGRLGSDKASSFSDQAVENERRIVEKYRAQLADLPKSSHPLQEEQDLEGELSNLEYQIARTANELRALTRNIESKEKELQHYEGQLGEVLPKYTDKNGRLEKYIQQLTSYQDAVNTVADQIFASFCQRLGYNNIRDYESQQGTFEQEAAEKRLEFTKQTSRLQNMNSHYESQLKAIDERVEALEEKAERDRANIAEFEAEKEELQSSIDVLQAELETLKEQLVRQREAKEKRAAAVTEARAELDKRSTAVAGVKKAVDTEQANIKRTAATRYALLRKCKIDEIKIPLVEGSRSLNQLPIGDAARADPDAMDVDEDPDSTQIQQPDVDDYGIDVDYDVLDDDLKDASIPISEPC
jgi:structural maintenance of chromosome 1